MHSTVTITSANTRHVIPPDDYRSVVLARRFDMSGAMSNLLAELCFGSHREHWATLPATTVGKSVDLEDLASLTSSRASSMGAF